MTRGRDHLEQAIALDARFAAAHSALGWCLFGMVTENLLLPGEAGPLMRASAQRALAIDPSPADPYSVLALAAVLDYDWPEAGKQSSLRIAQDWTSRRANARKSSRCSATIRRTISRLSF